jgi:exodeoxyribonuclease VII large subunit
MLAPRPCGAAAARPAGRDHLATAAIPRESAASPVTDQAARRAVPAPGLVAADGPDQPTLGVAELQWRVGEAVSAAFPDRVWLCGEVVGTPAIRRGGAGIAFTLAESHGSTVLTLRAWLGRPYYQQLRQQLGDAAIAELLRAGNLVVVGGSLEYGGPFSSLELKVDRVVRTPAGPGEVTQQRQALQQDLAASGLLDRQRATLRLPLAPRRVGIVAGGAGTVGYADAVAVLRQSGFQVATTHFPAPLEGETAPARIAAQIRAAGVGNQAVLVVRGGGEDAQLSPFDSAPVVSAIATAPVPVITGIGHSRHDTLADAAAWQACVSPAAAAAVVAERLQRAERTLEQELAAIRRAAQARLAARHAARWRQLGFAVAAVGLAALAVRWGGWLAAVAVVVLALAAVAVRRRRPALPRLEPQPWADTFEEVVQELGAVKAALQQGAATGEDVQRLLQAAEWLDRRGGELLGRDRSASRPAG